MSIQWNCDEIAAFFGIEPELSLPRNPKIPSRCFIFVYQGTHLEYQVWVDEETEQISISGDTMTPFGGTSLYEIYLPCDSISLIPNASTWGATALAAWYGPQSDVRNRRLMLYRREDGDLTVWPAFPFPEGHVSMSQKPQT